jgi:hypothetical protein
MESAQDLNGRKGTVPYAEEIRCFGPDQWVLPLSRRERRPEPAPATVSRLANLPLQSYALPMADAATLVMWFQLRSPELAEEFERLMASDRDIVHSSLETMPDWRLTRPTDVPGQASESADYVLIAEIVNIEHWQQQAEQRVQALADDLEHLVSSRRMLVLERIL